MKEKRNIHELIVKEEPHLNEILDPEQVKKFKELTNELRDTWTKKQMFRTKTEMEFSVLNDAKYPTNAAKYWQCVREQNTHMENLMQLSFEARKNDIKIKQKVKELEEETDELKKEIIQVSFNNYDRAAFRLKNDLMIKFYEAIIKFDTMANSDDFQWKHVLKPGELLIFNNWRILHGRKAFKGSRKMSGCYINKEDFDSACKINNIV